MVGARISLPNLDCLCASPSGFSTPLSSLFVYEEVLVNTGVGLAKFIKICTCGVDTLPTVTSRGFSHFSGTVLPPVFFWLYFLGT